MPISKPVRAVRSYTQQLVAPPHIVFPLLCPVREAEWANGWDPIRVWSASGFVEEDCVFTTPGEPAAIWVVTRLDPDRFFVEMVKVTPGVTVCRLTIQLEATENGSAPMSATATPVSVLRATNSWRGSRIPTMGRS